MSKRIAVIGVVLENPVASQEQFNAVIASFKGIIKGRMGLPMAEMGMSVISVIVVGTLDEINSLTGKIGKLKDVSVKTSISKKEISA